MVLRAIDHSAFVIESREKKSEELYKGGVSRMAQKVGKGHSCKCVFSFGHSTSKYLFCLCSLNLVASTSLFYPDEKPGVMGWFLNPSFSHPFGGNHKFLLWYILTFITSLVQAPIISCWDYCNRLLGLPVAAFIHSAKREILKRNVIFLSLNLVTDFLLPTE